MSKELDIEAQRDFELTQGVRRGIVQELLKKGPVPDTKEDSQTLLQTLRDMDAQNISRLRIKVEEKQADNSAMAAQMVSAVLREINPSHFAVPVQSHTVAAESVKQLPVEVVDNYQTVPGELEVNPPQGNIKDFMEKMRGPQS